MVRCADFYKRWEKDPNWCEKAKSSVQYINSYLDLVHEIESRGIDKEIIYAKMPEGAARPVIQIKDPEIRVKLLNYICGALGRSERIYPTELKNILAGYEGRTKPEKHVEDRRDVSTNVEKEAQDEPESAKEPQSEKPDPSGSVLSERLNPGPHGTETNQPAPAVPPCKSGQPCPRKYLIEQKILGNKCGLTGNLIVNQPVCPISDRERQAEAGGSFMTGNQIRTCSATGGTYTIPPPMKIKKTPLTVEEKEQCAAALIERTEFTPNDISQIDELVRAQYEGIKTRAGFLLKAATWFLAQAGGE